MKQKHETPDFNIEITPSSPYALVEGETHLFIQLKLIGKEIFTEESRQHLNLGIVLDRSGSMGGAKIQKAKEAVEFIINNLTDEDVAAVTIYDDRIETIVPSSKLTNRAAIIQKVRAIHSRNMTDLHGGLVEGGKQVETSKPLEYRNMVLLLSDGLANTGITDRDRIKTTAEQIYNGGIGISTFGLGNDFDEDLMVGIADAGGGTFYFIETADDIPKAIEKEFHGLLATSAYNIECEWKGIEGINITRVLGVPYEDRLAPKSKLGDLRASNEMLVILDLTLPPQSEGNYDVLSFNITYISRTGKTTPEHLQIPCKMIYTTDESKLAIENKAVLDNVQLLEASHVQHEAMLAADRGDFVTAQATMQAFQTRLNETVTDESPEELRQLQTDNQALMDNTLHREQYDKISRKQMKSQLYSLRKKR